MARRVQLIRHTTGSADAFTGLPGEITIDTTKKEVRVHDGLTLGGIAQARADLDNVDEATTSVAGKMAAADKVELAAATADAATNAANIATNVTAIGLNTAKVTNANHTGHVTGSGALTLVVAAITGQTDIGGALADADEVIVNDNGAIRRSAFSRIYTYIRTKLIAAANTWAAAQTFSGEVKLTQYNEVAAEYTISSGTINLNTAAATYFYPDADFDTDTPTFVFQNPVATGRVTSFVMELLGADGATITWPASVEWSAGDEPGWSAGKDIVSFMTRDGGTTWTGFLGGQNFA